MLSLFFLLRFFHMLSPYNELFHIFTPHLRFLSDAFFFRFRFFPKFFEILAYFRHFATPYFADATIFATLFDADAMIFDAFASHFLR